MRVDFLLHSLPIDHDLHPLEDLQGLCEEVEVYNTEVLKKGFMGVCLRGILHPL